jgi:tetratricopeptide (TPR) repeat protein
VALMDAAGIAERDRPEESRRKISELLGSEPDAALVADRLVPLLGVDPGRAAIQETFWAVRKLFEHLGAQRPLVAVFDDIQWGEPTFLDLLEYLADWLRGAPVLLLCLARPELLDVRPEWVTPKPNTTLVTLPPLTPQETDGLIQGLLEGDELEPEARARIAELAEGNPLFVEQTLRMLVDDEVLERRDGRWTATRDLSRITIPPTISALLTARLARLDPDERAVIERASIVGRVFWWAAVAEISGGDVRPHVISHLQSLTRKELIRPDYTEGREASFRFGHILIRDAAYHGIPKAERAELHERLADWLEVEARDMAGEFEEILGYHVEQARRLLLEVAPLGERAEALGRRAAAILGGAGARAFHRGDMPAAVNLLSRAAAVTPARTRERAELLAQLAFALLETGDLERLEDVVDEMTRTAVASSAAELEPYAAIMGLWLVLSWNPEGWVAAADEKATQAIAAFEAAGDERGLAKAWALVGLVHIERAQFRAAEDAWTRAAEHARRCGDRRDELESLSWVPLTVWAGPAPVDEGLERCAAVLARAEGDKKLMASALVAQAVFEADAGRFDVARTHIARAKALLEEVALILWLAGPVAQFAGWVELLAGDPVRAEIELRAGYERLEQIGELSWLSTLAGLLAEAVHRQGRDDEAERLTAASEESAGAEDAYSHAMLHSVRAEIRAARGDAAAAGRHGRRAVALADTTDFLHLRVHARLADAEALAAAGADPRGRIEEAIALAEAKGSVPEARRARDLLARLEGRGRDAEKRFRRQRA